MEKRGAEKKLSLWNAGAVSDNCCPVSERTVRRNRNPERYYSRPCRDFKSQKLFSSVLAVMSEAACPRGKKERHKQCVILRRPPPSRAPEPSPSSAPSLFMMRRTAPPYRPGCRRRHKMHIQRHATAVGRGSPLVYELPHAVLMPGPGPESLSREHNITHFAGTSMRDPPLKRLFSRGTSIFFDLYNFAVHVSPADPPFFRGSCRCFLERAELFHPVWRFFFNVFQDVPRMEIPESGLIKPRPRGIFKSKTFFFC